LKRILALENKIWSLGSRVWSVSISFFFGWFLILDACFFQHLYICCLLHIMFWALCLVAWDVKDEKRMQTLWRNKNDKIILENREWQEKNSSMIVCLCYLGMFCIACMFCIAIHFVRLCYLCSMKNAGSGETELFFYLISDPMAFVLFLVSQCFRGISVRPNQLMSCSSSLGFLVVIWNKLKPTIKATSCLFILYNLMIFHTRLQ